VALSGLIFLLLVLRRPDAVTNPQFWAEDGVIFFFGQTTHTGLGARVVPYAGYLHVVPRLVAAFAALLPGSSTPLIFNLFAFVIAAFCCSLFSLNWYRYLLQSDWLRVVVCVLIATTIQADELVGTITNVHWFLFLAIILILLQPAKVYEGRSPGAGYLSVILGVLGTLSEPLVVLLLPLSIWGAVRRKGLASLAPLAITLAAVVQIAVFLLGPLPEVSKGSTSLRKLVSGSVVGISYRVALSPVLGVRPTRHITRLMPYGAVFAIFVVLAACILYIWWRGNTRQRWIVATISYLSVASVALAMGGRSLAKHFPSSGAITWTGERYFFLGACLVVYLVAASIENRAPVRSKAGQAFVLVAVFAFGIFWNFRAAPFTDYHWDVYAPMVERWLAAKRSGVPVRNLSVPINPVFWMVDFTGLPSAERPLLEGQLIRRPGALPGDIKVYVLESGRKRWIMDPRWFQDHDYKWPDDVCTIPLEQLNAIPTGPPIW
jgi:hypothetical protein